jgi:multidrug efflux pump subunit AcrA (membrane-fusion protein)
MMKHSKTLLGVAALLSAISLTAEAKLYKWVDENGTTHYGETIPPKYANRDVKSFEKGRVQERDIAQDKNAKPRTKILSAEEEQAERRDNALINTYSSEKEIDLSRDRNLQQVEARISSYSTLLKSANENLAGLQQEQERLVKQGRKIPKSLEEDLENAKQRIEQFQSELDTNKAELDAVKARYAADKARYRELKGLPPSDGE